MPGSGPRQLSYERSFAVSPEKVEPHIGVNPTGHAISSFNEGASLSNSPGQWKGLEEGCLCVCIFWYNGGKDINLLKGLAFNTKTKS